MKISLKTSILYESSQIFLESSQFFPNFLKVRNFSQISWKFTNFIEKFIKFLQNCQNLKINQIKFFKNLKISMFTENAPKVRITRTWSNQQIFFIFFSVRAKCVLFFVFFPRQMFFEVHQEHQKSGKGKIRNKRWKREFFVCENNELKAVGKVEESNYELDRKSVKWAVGRWLSCMVWA